MPRTTTTTMPMPGPLALALPALLALAPPLAAGDGAQCAARDQVVAFLAARYGETRRGIGIAGRDAVMELFASDSTGTWTIVVTTGDGMTCLLASGERFRALAGGAPVPGDPV
ncbi:MAG: hypothetical protein N2422_00560 [Rhodobacteraceae bacterium]|nr:hypothetical protein [Paracoccaceae bacterium]